MPLQYDMTGIDPALAARINSTLVAARAVPNSKLNVIEANVQSTGIQFVKVLAELPPGMEDTKKGYMSGKQLSGFNDTLYVVIPPSRKFLTTSGLEMDPGIGVAHEVGHYQPGRDTLSRDDQEAAAVQDHIEVGRQLNIPIDQLRPGATWPRVNENENGTSPTLSIDKAEAEDALGHPFGGTQEEVSQLKEAIATGNVTALGDFVGAGSSDRQLAPFDATADKIVISFDQAGWFSAPAHYASVVTNGGLDRTVQFNFADGGRIDKFYDPANSQPWSTRTTDYAPDGNVTADQTVNDDGTSSLRTNNTDGTHAITTETLDGAAAAASVLRLYDAADRLVSETFRNDDGGTKLVSYDAAGTRPWLTQTALFGLEHNLRSEEINYDDGRQSVRVNDVDGAQNWVSQYTLFNAAHLVARQDTFNDDGTSVATINDLAGVQTWASRTELLDGFGRITQQTEIGDDQLRSVQVNDVDDVQSWSSIKTIYTPGNQVLEQDVVNDDQTAATTINDLAGAQTWLSRTETFDRFNRVTTQTEYVAVLARSSAADWRAADMLRLAETRRADRAGGRGEPGNLNTRSKQRGAGLSRNSGCPAIIQGSAER